MKILLLDMDGVLLTPGGYHKALQETVRLVGQTLGFGDHTLSNDDIADFEAVGITNEWDSSAITLALMLIEVWNDDPQVNYPTEIKPVTPVTSNVQFPDLAPFFQLIDQPHLSGQPPLKRARDAMKEISQSLDVGQQDRLLEILSKAHDIEHALTMRTFQELVLGSEQYEEIYKRSRVLETDSHLLKYDRSNVSKESLDHLTHWLQIPDQHAIIFTNRPSLFPDGDSGTPEAEIGAKLVGLSDLPYVAFGSLTWLAEQLDMSNQELIKPSPVHALAAMRLALGDNLKGALMTAADFALNDKDDKRWKELEGYEVIVFEDSVGGIQSLKAAQRLLACIGVKIKIKAYGISTATTKQQALREEGAIIYENIKERDKLIWSLSNF